MGNGLRTEDELGTPRRHGIDRDRSRAIARRLLPWIRSNAVEPSDRQWSAIGQSLVRGDGPMDRVVDWMMSRGLAAAKPLFDEAVENGIDRVDGAPAPLREFFAHVDASPAWVDRARLFEGARASGIAGLTGLDALRDLGLMAGYQASAINQTLVMTKALTKGAQRRVAETTKWWIACTRPGGMERFGPGFKATLHVRLIHALVRRRLLDSPEWDVAMYGVPVNQGDLHATHLAFSVLYLIGQRALGVILTSSEGADVMHLWRYISWIMGIEEGWLSDSEQQSRVALYQNLLSQAPPDETSQKLGLALRDEPLARHYPRARWWMGRWNRAKHLSIIRAFVGARGIRALGLSPWTLPWYPAITVIPRFVWHGVHRVIPGGRERLVRNGLAQQEAYLDVLFGL